MRCKLAFAFALADNDRRSDVRARPLLVFGLWGEAGVAGGIPLRPGGNALPPQGLETSFGFARRLLICWAPALAAPNHGWSQSSATTAQSGASAAGSRSRRLEESEQGSHGIGVD